MIYFLSFVYINIFYVNMYDKQKTKTKLINIILFLFFKIINCLFKIC